jgi:aconitate decarboxylase
MQDGSCIDSGEVPYARGHARLPVTGADVRRKFVDCARHGGCADVEGLFNLLGQLGEIADMRGLAGFASGMVGAG